MNTTATTLLSPRRRRTHVLSYAGPALITAGAAAVVFALLAALSTAMPAATLPESASLRPAQETVEQESRDDVLECPECLRHQHGWESVA